MPDLYYDCFAGISGDMNLGALVDLGLEEDRLRSALSGLPVSGYSLEIRRDSRRGIGGIRVEVKLEHGSEAEHHHRSFRDIRDMIQGSDLSIGVKKRSVDIFRKIADAEGRIHGRPADDVRFHEVGAVDSIVDIVGAAVGLEVLGVERVFASPVELGGGFVECAHGRLPVPAPATLEILKGVPVKTGLVPFETATPTGAAILASTVERFTERLTMRIERIGYGIGGRDTEIPNVLRVMLGRVEGEGREMADAAEADMERGTALLLECNIDDMNPERYDYVMERLLEAGAFDVFLTPTIMKKSRPAVILSVLCGEEQAHEMKETLFSETTTLGMRESRVLRTMLRREIVSRSTPYGKVRIKRAYFRGRIIRSKPEYDDCRRLAGKHGIPLAEVYRCAEEAGRDAKASDDHVDEKEGAD